ncbi:hypothetical protein MAXJ12_30242 [Mesorhizobium alhagi CCNWXJ12-2]|uniref:Uncharacterized protein n=1 Tax=Mesorhizobium alhagi CCNWXJ12-2 TaxID=1107882 RepID=H0I0R1_9HYPH|nr:hypothetical protein MAXJ12_30242 [Mesorhizobium alhagi CCNWXJ12-2]
MLVDLRMQHANHYAHAESSRSRIDFSKELHTV